MAQALVQRINSNDISKAEQSRATTETIILAVEGMHCGACIRSVETALGQVPGVASARVNLSSRRASVEVQRGRVFADILIEALAEAGHKAAKLTSASRIQAFDSDKDLLRRLGVAGFAAMNIMLLSVSVWSGAGADMDKSLQTLFHWLSALIALPAVAYSGQPFFRSAFQALSARRLNMDVPISLGVLLTTLMSLYQTTLASEQVYFDAAVTLLAFLLLGRFLDQQMRMRASSAAANLLGLKSSSASVLDMAGSVSRVPVQTLQPGARVLAAAGERLAVDGVVESGTSDIDQSLITGESLPARIWPGQTVFAGTMNLSNPIVITATKRDDNSLLAEIARLMTAAEQGRGKYVRLADRAARLYAPAVHILGLGTFACWIYAGHSWQAALTAAIAVLIVTCPCALALAVPAVQVAAASRLFSKGIILKAADGLERLAEVDTVVLDKTGTLTVGEPSLLNAAAISPESLAAAARLAVTSRHPYSRAIVAAAKAKGLDVTAGDGVREMAGFGMCRNNAHGEERLGSAEWCGQSQAAARDGTLWFKPAIGPALAFQFSDSLRDDARDVITILHRAGYAVEVLSGDAPGAVASAAHASGVAAWRAGQRPGEKLARLDALKAEGHKVLMVGDGLNDAPALAAAHASLSPASGSDISQTAADAIFQGSRLQPIVELLSVAKAARRLALQNFGLAVAYNVVFVPLAMAGLVTPLIAALAMSASSISVTANAIRLKSKVRELRA